MNVLTGKRSQRGSRRTTGRQPTSCRWKLYLRYSSRRHQAYCVQMVPSNPTLVLTAVTNPNLAADPPCKEQCRAEDDSCKRVKK